MIVQCQACQTRFRLADEKVKPGGTKVRCSKCKEIFTVTPPEPEPVEEAVDFGSFNMEAVAEDSPEQTGTTEEEAPAESSETEGESNVAPPAPEPETSADSDDSELDFSGLEDEMGDGAGTGEELADDFSFADTTQASDEEESGGESSGPDFDAVEEEQADFGAAFEETDEPDTSMEFDFSDDQESITAEPDTIASDASDESREDSSEFSFDDSEEEASESVKFSFEDEQSEPEQEDSGGFSFEEDSEGDAFSFDEPGDDVPTEESAPGEFSFDDETPFGKDSSSEWGDDSSGEDSSFDFEEPQFDAETVSAAEDSSPGGGDEGGLQFGEIDFAGDSDETGSSGDQEDDFANATMEMQDEPEPFAQQAQSPPPSRDYDDEEPLPAPPSPKKSSLSRILVLLVLLLVALGGAAGFMFMQQGSLNLNVVTEYLPFLKDYIGEPQEISPADSIDIDISGSSYVNGKAGQMLVIQGSAVNKHPASRSSITIKGVLLDANGKTLLQQTVFCGNSLSNATLETMPFKSIEEAMNNEFGDGLSNMNVAAGASIPFTIVFRNLPEGIANINVEVVDSKPGAN